MEQIIRPTGLIDPEITVKSAKHQIDDLMDNIVPVVEKQQRVLVTTLTKRMAEDLTEYLQQRGIRVQYLHSDIDTLKRIEIIRNLRLAKFDVLIGINLLREGLDIPEVALVAILDADKEGFLRSETSLIQTCGRAARNVNGRVIMYADTITGSMRRAIDETNRRREIQLQYNRRHGITPESVKKSINDIMKSIYESDYVTVPLEVKPEWDFDSEHDLITHINRLERQMYSAAKNLQFEQAALLRDQIAELRKLEL